MKNHKFFTSANFSWSDLEAMKIKSPLKQIIDAHKIKLKPYNPNEATKKINPPTGKADEPECWTYVKEKEWVVDDR